MDPARLSLPPCIPVQMPHLAEAEASAATARTDADTADKTGALAPLAMSVRQLKAQIARAGLSSTDCVTKTDLRARALEAAALLSGGEASSGSGGEYQTAEDEETEDEETDKGAGAGALQLSVLSDKVHLAVLIRLPRVMHAAVQLVNRRWHALQRNEAFVEARRSCPLTGQPCLEHMVVLVGGMAIDPNEGFPTNHGSWRG